MTISHKKNKGGNMAVIPINPTTISAQPIKVNISAFYHGH